MLLGRRDFLASTLLGALAASSQRLSQGASTKLGIPGPYRGRVVSVHHPACIVSDHYQAEPVRQMMRKGMMELTGAPSWVEAWRVFFEPGDVVGIKLNPAGRPYQISAPEVLHQIVGGLKQAGVRPRDIVVYDRFREAFVEAGYLKWLPEGVRAAWATVIRDKYQLDMEGYDPGHYMEIMLIHPGQDSGDAHLRRSYVAKFLTKEVNKLINLPVVKHHQGAGVTLALKNMSHGLVNNVSRGHISDTANEVGVFIPSVVNLPVIRQKAVLHILDGVKGAYHGGPNRKIAKYLWEHKTMYFATDPVALDKVGWGVIDAKRIEMGRAPVALQKPDADSTPLNCGVEHIEIAGALGLGEFDDKKIDWRKFNLS